MFNTRKLFDAIRCGKTTTFRFNRQTVRCTDAAQFQVTREGCSGVFGARLCPCHARRAGYAIGSMRFTNHGSRPIRLAEVMLFPTRKIDATAAEQSDASMNFRTPLAMTTSSSVARQEASTFHVLRTDIRSQGRIHLLCRTDEF